MHAPVIVVGEALIDIVVSRHGEAEHVGGSPANVAIGLKRLGHPTSLATHIGTDERGVRISDALAAEHVDLAPGSTRAERTPTATALLGTDGAATYAFMIEWELDPDLPVPAGAHLHTGSIAATLQPGAAAVREVLLRARAEHTISYDPNARPQLMGHPENVRPQVDELISASDVVKASDEDVEWLYGHDSLEETLAYWASLGAILGVVTRGGEGAVVHIGGRRTAWRCPPSRWRTPSAPATPSCPASCPASWTPSSSVGSRRASASWRPTSPRSSRPWPARSPARRSP